MNIFPFYEVWGRVVAETPLKRDIDLAELLQISASNITRRKKENVFPIDWAFTIARKYNLTTEWLLTGEGPRNFSQMSLQNSLVNATLKQADTWLAELVNNEPRRSDWFSVAFEDAFPMFKEWKKRRDSQEGGASLLSDRKIA